MGERAREEEAEDTYEPGRENKSLSADAPFSDTVADTLRVATERDIRRRAPETRSNI